MKAYQATTTIAAAPDAIWALLTNAAGYPEWDPGVDRIEGRIAPGEKITAYTKLSPGRAFPVTVTEFEPGRRMTWASGLPLGLFKGQRTFTLLPKGDGVTEFTLREEFSGPLLALIGRTIPDLTSTFEQFAAGLKGRAEQAG
jgi:hypothetical protein